MSKVTEMTNMFLDFVNLNRIKLWNVNTSLVQNMSRLFKNCKSLISIDLSYFNTCSVTQMSKCLLIVKK